MIRTQIYLTEPEKNALAALVAATGKPQSELIRDAVDAMIERSSQDQRKAVLKRTAGLWRGRKDLPDFRAIRASWDRKDRT